MAGLDGAFLASVRRPPVGEAKVIGGTPSRAWSALGQAEPAGSSVRGTVLAVDLPGSGGGSATLGVVAPGHRQEIGLPRGCSRIAQAPRIGAESCNFDRARAVASALDLAHSVDGVRCYEEADIHRLYVPLGPLDDEPPEAGRGRPVSRLEVGERCLAVVTMRSTFTGDGAAA